jgi:teichuronic acid biosynthesis glycosyltransferase TuaC
MSKGRHVLFITEDFLPPDETMGGVRVSIRYQAEGLARSSSVTVLAPRRLLPPLPRYRRGALTALSSRSAASEIEEGTGIRVLRPSYLHLPILWPITEPLQLLLIGIWVTVFQVRDVRLFHGHRAYPSGVLAVLLAKLFRRPSVVTVYGSDVHSQAAGDPSPVQVMTRFAIHRASRVVAVSKSLIAQAIQVGADPDRCRYVPSGVDTDRFVPVDRGTVRRELGVPAGLPMILCSSLFVPVKGHAVLIEAFRKLRDNRIDATLVMTGDGPLRERIQRMAGEMGVGDSVRFAGLVSYPQVPLWMGAADILVLPSHMEGMPLVVLEGLACGTPVVGSAVGGIPELVSDPHLGVLVEAGNPGALCDAIERCLDRHWDRDRLRQRALEFSWPRVIDRLEIVYRELTTVTPPPR